MSENDRRLVSTGAILCIAPVFCRLLEGTKNLHQPLYSCKIEV